MAGRAAANVRVVGRAVVFTAVDNPAVVFTAVAGRGAKPVIVATPAVAGCGAMSMAAASERVVDCAAVPKAACVDIPAVPKAACADNPAVPGHNAMLSVHSLVRLEPAAGGKAGGIISAALEAGLFATAGFRQGEPEELPSHNVLTDKTGE